MDVAHSTAIDETRLATKRMRQNADRVQNLITFALGGTFAEELKGVDAETYARHPRIDALRACTVFTHAMLEDFMRRVGIIWLPLGEPAGLADIPFKGGQERHIRLDQLARHGVSPVSDVVRQSVEAWLGRTSFNNSTDVVNHLKRLRIPIEPFEFLWPVVDWLTTRRHQIVHDADLPPEMNAPPRAPGIQAIEKTVLALGRMFLLCGGVARHLLVRAHGGDREKWLPHFSALCSEAIQAEKEYWEQPSAEWRRNFPHNYTESDFPPIVLPT